MCHGGAKRVNDENSVAYQPSGWLLRCSIGYVKWKGFNWEIELRTSILDESIFSVPLQMTLILKLDRLLDWLIVWTNTPLRLSFLSTWMFWVRADNWRLEGDRRFLLFIFVFHSSFIFVDIWLIFSLTWDDLNYSLMSHQVDTFVALNNRNKAGADRQRQ